MSKIIHMDTERVRTFAMQTSLQLDEMENVLNETGKRVRSLPWEGGSHDQFVADFKRLENQLASVINQGRSNLQRVQREVDEWVGVDQQGEASIASVGSVLTGIGGFIQGSLIDFWLTYTRKKYEDDFTNWWDSQTVTGKKDFLREQQKAIAKDLGVDPIGVNIYDIEDPEGKDARGYYDGTGIYLDEDNLNSDDPWELVNTVAHETRHAFQDHVVQVYKETGKPPEGVGVRTAETWQENYANYVTPEDDFEGYRGQPIEVDARNIGHSYSDRVLVSQPWKS